MAKKKRVVGEIQPRKKAPRGTAEETARILAAQGRTGRVPTALPSRRTRERGGRERGTVSRRPVQDLRPGIDAPEVEVVRDPKRAAENLALAATFIPGPQSIGIRAGQIARAALPSIGRRGAQTTAQEAARFRKAAKELQAQAKGQPKGSTEAGKISEVEGARAQKFLRRRAEVREQNVRQRREGLQRAFEEDEALGEAFSREQARRARAPAARLKAPPQTRAKAERAAGAARARGREPAEVRTLPNVEAQMRRIRIKREQAQGLPSSDAERARVAARRIRGGSIPPQNRVPGITGRPQPIPPQPRGAEFAPAVQQVAQSMVGGIRGSFVQSNIQDRVDARRFGISRRDPKFRQKLKAARKRAAAELRRAREAVQRGTQ